MAELFLTQRYRHYYQKFEPLFKTKQVQAYIMVVLSLFTIAFFGAFAIRPTLKTIATLRRQIGDKTLVNQRLEEKINNLILAQEEYQRVEADLPTLYSLLPEKAEFPALLRKLEVLAIENGATISGIQFDPIVLYGEVPPPPAPPAKPVEQSPHETTPQAPAAQPVENLSTPLFFGLVLTGPYENLLITLNQLTKLDRLITIQSADLSGSTSLIVSVQSRAYYYPLDL